MEYFLRSFFLYHKIIVDIYYTFFSHWDKKRESGFIQNLK